MSRRARWWVFGIVMLAVACDRRAEEVDRTFPLRATAARLLADERPFEARLAGSRRWAPCNTGRRGGTQGPAAHCGERRVRPALLDEAASLAARARAALHSSPADAAWAMAVLDLAWAGPQPELTDRTIDHLAGVVARDERNAAAQNDLAVAYLARASTRGDARSLFLALDHVERAAELDTTSSVIAFNRALILDRLHLYEEAEAAWTSFLRRADDGEWRAEAAERLSALRQSRVQPAFTRLAADGHAQVSDLREAAVRDPQGAREHVLDVLLPAWARASLRGDSAGAASASEAMTAIGDALAAAGDSSVAHVVGACQEPSGWGTEQLRTLARAVAAYDSGAVEFREGAFNSAAPALARAVQGFRSADRTTLAGWADVMLAAVELYRADYAAADARYARVARQARARSDRALEGRALWGWALSVARQGRAAQAIDRYSAASAIFERIGEQSNYGSMQSQLADVLFLLGRDDASVAAQHRALAALRSGRHPRIRHGLLLALGAQLSEMGLSATGLAVLRESVRSAASTARPKDRPEALIRLGAAEAAAGHAGAARARLAEARAALGSVHDSLMRDWMAMEVAAAEAAALAPTEPSVALARLTQVDEYYARQRIVFFRGPILARRARVRLRLADTVEAQRDLAAAAELIEAQATGTLDPGAARDLASAWRAVYRELVAMAVARHDTATAFAYAERGRALRARRQAVAATPRADEAVLSYIVLPRETVVWITTTAHRRMARILVPDDRFRQLVDRFERLIRGESDSVALRAVARELYTLLVAPAEPEVRRARALVLVTDGVLGRVPFAALRDRDDRYLVEAVAIRHARSMADIGTAGRAIDRAERGAPALIVGNPIFDRTAFPELEPLRGAEREVAVVAAAYTTTRVIRGEAATKGAILQELPRSGVLHFAGHARLVERAPMLSHLVLARDANVPAENALSAGEIAHLDLRRLRLVVLSACGTTQARSWRDDTQDGLSEAFLDAGARAVISSLWEADDEGTAALMGKLHRFLAAGVAGPEALRRAQLELLAAASPHRSPRAWSAFRYDGG